jgi:hypothetical protein
VEPGTVAQVASQVPAILASIVAPSIAVLTAIALWRKAEAERQRAAIELELKKLALDAKRPREKKRRPRSALIFLSEVRHARQCARTAQMLGSARMDGIHVTRYSSGSNLIVNKFSEGL